MTVNELMHWGKKAVIMDVFIAASTSIAENCIGQTTSEFSDSIGIGGKMISARKMK